MTVDLNSFKCDDFLNKFLLEMYLISKEIHSKLYFSELLIVASVIRCDYSNTINLTRKFLSRVSKFIQVLVSKRESYSVSKVGGWNGRLIFAGGGLVATRGLNSNIMSENIQEMRAEM